MLNRLVRYGPVIRRLDRMERANILEVGSGSLGLCEFYDQKVVGCDIEFKAPISPRLVPVQSCGLHLPFAADVAYISLLRLSHLMSWSALMY